YARLVAKKYKTDHHDIVVKPNWVGLIKKLVRHYDEPFGDSSAIPTYLVSEFAAKHVKVALSGDGGDEFFAGYRIVGDVQRFRFLDRVPRSLRKLVSWTADELPYFAYGKNFLHMVGSQSPLERYFNLNFMPYYTRKRLLSPEWMLSSDVDMLKHLLPDNFLADGADIVPQAMYFEATTILTGDFLVKVDRASMAASLEVRCPFLDHQLAEFATRIPVSWKWQGDKGKRILLQALGDRLPRPLLTRGKMGFGVPLDQWF